MTNPTGPGENDIVFTQYLMPQGKKQIVWTTRPASIAEKARKIVESGWRFECEMLNDYKTVSLTITDDDDDWAIEVVPNGLDVPAAIDRMITKFNIEKMLKKK